MATSGRAVERRGRRENGYKTLQEYVDAQPRTMTLQAIAESFNVSRPTLYAWLNRQRFPSRRRALEIERITGIPLSELLNPSSEVTV